MKKCNITILVPFIAIFIFRLYICYNHNNKKQTLTVLLYCSGSSGSLMPTLLSVENWVSLKPVQGGVRDVARIHYPSCTDSIKPSLQYPCNFVVINASEGSLCFQIFVHFDYCFVCSKEKKINILISSKPTKVRDELCLSSAHSSMICMYNSGSIQLTIGKLIRISSHHMPPKSSSLAAQLASMPFDNVHLYLI
jgi:hypothetical protein